MVEKHANKTTELVVGNVGQRLMKGQRVDLDWAVRDTGIRVEALGADETPGEKSWTKRKRGPRI